MNMTAGGKNAIFRGRWAGGCVRAITAYLFRSADLPVFFIDPEDRIPFQHIQAFFCDETLRRGRHLRHQRKKAVAVIIREAVVVADINVTGIRNEKVIAVIEKVQEDGFSLQSLSRVLRLLQECGEIEKLFSVIE